MWAVALVALGAMACARPSAQAIPPKTPLELVRSMVANEDAEAAHRQVYAYRAQERSERTGGRIWTEHVVQTAAGRVRLLLAIDGRPLDPAARSAELARLDAIAADPRAFEAKEAGERSDEANARKMLDLLPRAFLFGPVRLRGGVWTMQFRPDPAYSPHGTQERVLYGMSGTLAIDAAQERLIHIDGSLKQDVSIGFGILATVHAGSHFSSDRREVDGHWRTLHVVSAIEGKAALFKVLSRNTDVTRSAFEYLPPGTTVAQAVTLLKSSSDTGPA